MFEMNGCMIFKDLIRVVVSRCRSIIYNIQNTSRPLKQLFDLYYYSSVPALQQSITLH